MLVTGIELSDPPILVQPPTTAADVPPGATTDQPLQRPRIMYLPGAHVKSVGPRTRRHVTALPTPLAHLSATKITPKHQFVTWQQCEDPTLFSLAPVEPTCSTVGWRVPDADPDVCFMTADQVDPMAPRIIESTRSP